MWVCSTAMPGCNPCAEGGQAPSPSLLTPLSSKKPQPQTPGSLKISEHRRQEEALGTAAGLKRSSCSSRNATFPLNWRLVFHCSVCFFLTNGPMDAWSSLITVACGAGKSGQGREAYGGCRRRGQLV